MAEVLKVTQGLLSTVYSYIPGLPSSKEIEKVIVREIEMARPNAFYRLAGLSGAIAVAMGAYGAHVFRPSYADERLKDTFRTGYMIHLVHSVALMGTPMARRPVLVGSLMTVGTLLFSGSCYYHALSGNTSVRYITPYGGMMIICAWLAMTL
ncbi:transmembrane protein 256 homolog [Haliotis rufescens]|uniref:transmembrane protein 256 homolog n=1 Tax=Haliotis rufescens TaxID=6454 RepID=UPI00201F9C20|nr:transmembrane protein 256 homolog [Haliotis rufescens]